MPLAPLEPHPSSRLNPASIDAALELAVTTAGRRQRLRSILAAQGVESLIGHLAFEFDQELPGYEVDWEVGDEGEPFGGDNYFLVGPEYVAAGLRLVGVNPDEHWELIDFSVEGQRERSSTATTVAYQGGGGREECEIAAGYWHSVDQHKSLQRIPPVPRTARSIVAGSMIWRIPLGRAVRLRTNHRT